MSEQERYYLSKDNDGHRYLVPLNKRGEWMKWLDESTKYWDELPDSDPPEMPEGVKEIGGGIVSFTDPRDDEGMVLV